METKSSFTCVTWINIDQSIASTCKGLSLIISSNASKTASRVATKKTFFLSHVFNTPVSEVLLTSSIAFWRSIFSREANIKDWIRATLISVDNLSFISIPDFYIMIIMLVNSSYILSICRNGTSSNCSGAFFKFYSRSLLTSPCVPNKYWWPLADLTWNSPLSITSSIYA